VVNASGTQGDGGGIAGNKVVYSQGSGPGCCPTNWDVFLYDLKTHVRTRLSSPSATRPSLDPSISGQYVLFTRGFGHGFEKVGANVILLDLQTHHSAVLDKGGQQHDAYAGQVSGHFAVWERCAVSGKCVVFERDLASSQTHQIVDPVQATDSSPSVTPGGIVYFVRSTGDCTGDQIVKVKPGGSPTAVATVAKPHDASDTFALATKNGGTRVYFVRSNCLYGTDFDIYSVTG
jgi:Tol biopolymer transport system component